MISVRHPSIMALCGLARERMKHLRLQTTPCVLSESLKNSCANLVCTLSICLIIIILFYLSLVSQLNRRIEDLDYYRVELDTSKYCTHCFYIKYSDRSRRDCGEGKEEDEEERRLRTPPPKKKNGYLAKNRTTNKTKQNKKTHHKCTTDELMLKYLWSK